MNSGQHAPGRRPPGGQPGLALGRGVLLLVVAIVVGIVLLRSVPTPTAPGSVTQPTTTTTSTQPSNLGGGTTRTTTPTLLAPSKVIVLVANGTSVPAGAGNLVNALKGVGYMALIPYDTTPPDSVSTSAIYYKAGYAPEADALATLLKQPATEVAALPSSVPVVTTMAFDVMVIEGTTLATSFADPVSLTPSGTTSTTIKTTSTSTTTTSTS